MEEARDDEALDARELVDDACDEVLDLREELPDEFPPPVEELLPQQPVQQSVTSPQTVA